MLDFGAGETGPVAANLTTFTVTGTGSAVTECEIWLFSRDVLEFLPSCHGASTVKQR